MWAANLLGGMIVLILGLMIRIFKLSFLIAGYNTASKAEKAKYDTDKLTKNVGNMLILSSLILFGGGFLSQASGNPVKVISVSWKIYIAALIGGLIFINTGNRVKK